MTRLIFGTSLFCKMTFLSIIFSENCALSGPDEPNYILTFCSPLAGLSYLFIYLTIFDKEAEQVA